MKFLSKKELKADQEFPCPSCGALREYADCIQDGKCDQCPSLLSKKDDSYSDNTQWPGQAASEDTLSRPQGAYAYCPEKQGSSSKNKKLNIDKVIQVLNEKGPKVTNLDLLHRSVILEDGTTLSFEEAVAKAMELNKNADGGIIDSSWSQNFFWSPEDIGAGDQIQPFPNTGWLPASDQNLDEQPYSNIAASKRDNGSVPRSEAKWRVKLFDGRGVQYFPDEHSARAYYEVALKEGKDPSKAEPFVYKKALSKKELTKKAEENILSQDQQDEIAAKWCPAMNILLDNYVQAVKNGHDKNRALQYALVTIQGIDKNITKAQAIEAINTYLVGLV